MTKEVLTVEPEASIRDVAKILVEHGISGLTKACERRLGPGSDCHGPSRLTTFRGPLVPKRREAIDGAMRTGPQVLGQNCVLSFQM
jgi:hypothetical protein